MSSPPSDRVVLLVFIVFRLVIVNTLKLLLQEMAMVGQLAQAVSNLQQIQRFLSFGLDVESNCN